MDELTNELKRLGEAAGAAIEPVTAAEAIQRSAVGAQPVDIGLERGSHDPRHARRAPSAKLLAGAAAAALVIIASIVFVGRNDGDPVDLASAQSAQTFTAPDDDNGWSALRSCESRGDYGIDTGNTFYGAYQLTRETFQATATDLRLFDYADMNPAQVPPHVQDAVANALYLEQGVEPWPVCGRYLTGPMVTPVVPQWLHYAATGIDQVLVFMDARADEDQIANALDAIDQLVPPNEDLPVRFVDQADAYAEFRDSFVWTDEERGSVAVDDMPTRFEISARVTQETLVALRSIDGVIDVIDAAASTGLPSSGPMRLSIPAIGLETPVYPVPTNDGLAAGAALMVDSPEGLVIAGFGSSAGSVFSEIDGLSDGDTIRLTTFVFDVRQPLEVVRTYQVDKDDTSPPPVYELGDLLLWQAAEGPGLTLVADVEGHPEQRFRLRARAVPPDQSGYPVLSGDG